MDRKHLLLFLLLHVAIAAMARTKTNDAPLVRIVHASRTFYHHTGMLCKADADVMRLNYQKPKPKPTPMHRSVIARPRRIGSVAQATNASKKLVFE